MEATPTEVPNEKKEFLLNIEDEKYYLIVKNNMYNITFSLSKYNESLSLYEHEFSLNEIKQKGNSLNSINVPQQFMQLMEMLNKHNKINVEKEANDLNIKLVLKVPILFNEEEIILELEKSEIDESNENINLKAIIRESSLKFASYKEQTDKRIYELEKEVEELRLFKQKSEKIIKKLVDEEEKFQKESGGSDIMDKKESELLINKIRQITKVSATKKAKISLLYKGTKDGDDAKTFHAKCDGKKNQLLVIKSKKGLKFGGFTSEGWKGRNSLVKDKNSFLFSLDLKKTYDAIENLDTVYDYKTDGPTFGNNYDLNVPNKFLSMAGQVYTANNRFKTQKDFEINGGEEYFYFQDLEVFQVHFD